MRVYQALFCSVLLFLLFGCGFKQATSENQESSTFGNSTGTSGSPAPQRQYLYSANGWTPVAVSSISGFAIDAATGTLTPVPGSPFESGPQPYNLATDLGRNLYLADVTEEANLRVLPIASATGVLGSAHATDFAGSNYEDEPGCCPGPVAVDKGGRFLYVGNTENNTVDAYAIDPTSKALVQFDSQSLQPGHFPGQLLFDEDQKFLFVLTDVNGLNSLLYVFWRESYQGDLTLAAGPYTFSSASQIAISTDNRFLYVAEDVTGQARIDVLSIQADGSLRPASSVTTPDGALAVGVNPNGKLVAIAGDHSIELFAVNADGSLTATGHTATIGEGWIAPSVSFDDTGQYLYMSSDVSNRILGFRIDDSSLGLFGIPGSPWTTGDQPHSLLLVPPR